ncbi:uncharacterized protein LOC115428539 isoform X2 [Sphaeramia orbicularis]|uniref:uncharacterized protein LOC115428539 isoform X2 n=1 Tax=Sphaeramia orbicularis TaxID=375764 RepID=UPI00117C895D|nr:uncharacterized protein LOC115428539 isoform X2 [Sphaeramia orbicularis]
METGAVRPKSGFADFPIITELLRRLSIGHFLEGVGKSFPLKNPHGAKWILGGEDDTIYKGKDAEVNGWGKFYLPKQVKMKVIGVIEGTSCPNEQLVLMICEDGAFYAYDGEELHAVASNLDHLLNKGIEYPAAKSYYKGEAFKDMTKEQWAEVRKGAVGKRLEEEHRKLVTANKSSFLEILKSTKQHKGVVSSGAGTDIRKKPEIDISQVCQGEV